MSERAKAMNRFRYFATPVPETEEAARILNEAEFNISVRKHRMGFGMSTLFLAGLFPPLAVLTAIGFIFTKRYVRWWWK